MVYTQVFTLSQMITQSFLFQVSINFQFTIAFMFAQSCLKFAEINHQPIFVLFQITEFQI
ncbi:MAG: hypothetical protein LBQ24_05055 [Candidatus Peribacteria bacterium]|nr:hypothetical protein [Candidatus Peribacteria bacterium]